MNKVHSVAILMADDDADDRELTREALEESHMTNPMFFVEDGEALMDFLHHRGLFSASDASTRPGLILLDLNMPRKSGHEALAEIKADPELRGIPVVVLTTSKAEQDILASYDLGANSFIVKPATFEGMVDMVNTLNQYWFDLVSLPEEAV